MLDALDTASVVWSEEGWVEVAMRFMAWERSGSDQDVKEEDSTVESVGAYNTVIGNNEWVVDVRCDVIKKVWFDIEREKRGMQVWTLQLLKIVIYL